MKLAYRRRAERSLFNLFFKTNTIKRLRFWTSEELNRGEKKPASAEEFNAFFGLKIAFSMIPRNLIRYLWSTKDFLGSMMLNLVLGRQSFTAICSALKIYSDYDHSVAISDPL